MKSPLPRSAAEYRIAAVLNTASGTCTLESAEEMGHIFQEAGVTPVGIWAGDSDHIESLFAEAESHQPDVLIVLGGDGTIRTAAMRSSSPGTLLVPLPGGTMNFLPRALYGDRAWQDILRDVLARPAIKSVAGGMVGSERFYIAAVCGAPALWAHVREAARVGEAGKVLEHASVAFGKMFASKITYHFNDQYHGDAEAVVVTCPLIAPTLDEGHQGLESAVIDVNHAGDAIALATVAAFGSWRESANVQLVPTATVTITSTERVPVILDGETIETGKEVTIEFVPEAFKALVPAHEVLH